MVTWVVETVAMDEITPPCSAVAIMPLFSDTTIWLFVLPVSEGGRERERKRERERGRRERGRGREREGEGEREKGRGSVTPGKGKHSNYI